jgi:hypothetical protein
MANLFNSMVRGFGGQIGRTAANRMMHSTPQRASGKQWLIAILLFITIICGMGWMVKEGNKNNKESKSINTNVDSVKTEIEYYKGHVVHTGKRGGRYYYTKSGNKRYF